MENLPKESGGSISKGIWFVIQDNENTVIVGGSTFSGKEYVYVNGKLLSEKRSWKKRSEHHFMIDQTDCKVILDVQNILTGRMVCSLFKGNEIVKELSSKWRIHTRRLIFELLIVIIIAGLVGGIVGFFDLPLYWLALGIPIIFIKFQKPSVSIEIEELKA